MTEDYKDTLLRYLTGNLVEETKPNIPVIGTPVRSNSTLGSYLNANAGFGYEIKDLLQGYQSNYAILYGNKQNKNGFIVIIDENYNPVQYISAYNTGTTFGEFQVLNVAEDGNIYGIDIKNGTPRFIMLNNITLKLPTQADFSVRLRQSYNLPSPLSTASEYFAITKAVGQGKYLIGATVKNSNNNRDNLLATELTIIVGASNEWIDHLITYAQDLKGCDIWASWDEEEIEFRIEGKYTNNGIPYTIGFYTNNGNIGLSNISYVVSGSIFEVNAKIINKYVVISSLYDGGDYGTNETNKIYYSSNYNQLKLEELKSFTTSVAGGSYPAENRSILKVHNGIGYFMVKNHSKSSGVNDLYLYVGTIIPDLPNDTASVYNTEAIASGDTEEYNFYISNLYNLYNYNVLGLDISSLSVDSYNFLIQQVYNVNNYNGEPYENTNSLIANSGILYDSNNLILFARNLYNKSVYGNTTLSVLQIPNTMVNDITIDKQNLIGQTNKVLMSNTEDFTKNIYETVYLNFYNTLLIQNRNTPSYITNQHASELLNQSTSLAGDYDDMKATKYKINYIDGTNEIFETQPTITNGVATYNIQLVIPWNNLATSLQIISEDETTTYQTISTSNLEPGKVYNITQECYVE